MPDRNDDFRDLMRRLREGSEDAAWELVERYGETIRRAVRRSLNWKLRAKFDSMDFVQLVWLSFFRARHKLERFDSPAEIVAFLVTMARNKVGMEVRRRLLTRKYDVNREYPLDKPIAGHQPAPIDVAIAREQWDRMLLNQPKQYRQMIRLRLQGRTYEDVAHSLQVSERTVRRFIKKLLCERVA